MKKFLIVSGVVVYSPHPSEFMEGINKRFEEKNPNIKIQMVRAKTTELEDRIRSEKANPLGDVMYGGDVGTFIQMKRSKLIQPMAITAASQLPPDMKDPEGYWHAPYRLFGNFLLQHHTRHTRTSTEGLERPSTARMESIFD